MFLRFETTLRHHRTRWGAGLLHVLSEVDRDNRIDPSTQSHINQLREWFNLYLPAPAPKQIPPRAIFWFRMTLDLSTPAPIHPWKRRPKTKLAAKLSHICVPRDRKIDEPPAAQTIEKMKQLAELVNRTATPILCVTTSRPGYIVYQDSYQIAAIPFRDDLRKASDEQRFDGYYSPSN